MKRFILGPIFALLALTFGLSGCELIGGVFGGSDVTVSGLTLDRDSLGLSLGETATLTATISPASATNKALNWSSSDAAIATVDSSGKITGLAPGDAVISARTSDGGKVATCAVKVTLYLTGSVWSSTGAETPGYWANGQFLPLSYPTAYSGGAEVNSLVAPGGEVLAVGIAIADSTMLNAVVSAINQAGNTAYPLSVGDFTKTLPGLVVTGTITASTFSLTYSFSGYATSSGYGIDSGTYTYSGSYTGDPNSPTTGEGTVVGSGFSLSGTGLTPITEASINATAKQPQGGSLGMEGSLTINGIVYSASLVTANSSLLYYSVPALWTNGTYEELPVPAFTGGGAASDVALRDTSIVVAGYVGGFADTSLPCLWRDGSYEQLPVPQSATGGSTLSIAVDGARTYVVGGVYESAGERPALWQDGVLTELPLPPQATKGSASGIVIVDGEPLVSGWASESSTTRYPCYWQGGQCTVLSFPSTYTWARASRIAVSGSTTYISGYVKDGAGLYQPCYWLNGNFSLLDLPADAASGCAYGVKATANNFYMGGYVAVANGDETPGYWANGIYAPLAIPAQTPFGYAYVARGLHR